MTSVLDRLDVSTRALKRAQYEAVDFRLTDDGVTVRSGSHANPDEHVYDVTITEGVPIACTCPADEHHDTACTHRLAVAIREPVLDAVTAQAAADEQGDDESEGDRDDDPSCVSPTLVADGAGVTDPPGDDSESADPERPDDCACPDEPVGFPCWPCVRDGYRDLPADGRGDPADD